MPPIKIMIVDDEPIIRKALKLELNAQPHTVACGMNDDGDIQRREVRVLDTFASGPQMMAALDSPAEHEMPDYLLVDMEFHYRRPITYGMRPRIDIIYRPTEAAKIIFDYEIHDPDTDELMASGHSVQVFMDKNYQLMWTNPDFYAEWKKRVLQCNNDTEDSR